MSLVGNFFIRLRSKLIGKDEFGNEYYLGDKKNYLGQQARYVIYSGISEGSKVPPRWHAWLHYGVDEVPDGDVQEEKYSWQKKHLPNLTGTKYAYKKKELKRQKVQKYSSWSPAK